MRCHSGRENHGFIGGCVRCARTACRENVVSINFRPERIPRSVVRSADRPASPACLQTSRSAPNLLDIWHITCPILTLHAVSRIPIPQCQREWINREHLIEIFRFKIDPNRPFFFLFLTDALHGQWHDGQRCYPGCSWLSPWSSPWGNC